MYCSEELESLQQAPVEWADEETDRFTARKHGSRQEIDETSFRRISSIAFPSTRFTSRQGDAARPVHHRRETFAVAGTDPDEERQTHTYQQASTSPRRQAQTSMPRTGEPSRFNSLPTRAYPERRATILSDHKLRGHHNKSVRSEIALHRANSFSECLDDGAAPNSGSSSEATTSHDSERKVTDSVSVSLPRRSIRSLRNIASVWTSYATGTPADTDAEQQVTVSCHRHSTRFAPTSYGEPRLNGQEGQNIRPPRLDKRRLDKAVSLAVEAAQAAREDEKMWKRRQLRHQQIVGSNPSTHRSASRRGGLATLPWSRASSTKANDALGGPSKSTQVSSAESATPPEAVDSLDATDSEESDGREVSDGFSMDLYISSLGYLLSALRPEDAIALSQEQREQLVSRLHQALEQLGENVGSSTETMTQNEEFFYRQVKQNLALLDSKSPSQNSTVEQWNRPSMQYSHFNDSWDPSLAATIARTDEKRGRPQSTVAGTVAFTAFDFGLSVGASLVTAASRSIERLLPSLEAGEVSVASSDVIRQHEDNPQQTSVDPMQTSRHERDGARKDALLTGAQWDLTRTLAGSIASTLYNQLALVASPRDCRGEHAVATRDRNSNALVAANVLAKGEGDPAERLILMSTTLARSIKRSPLPSQVHTLASQMVALAGAIDRRYSLRKRSADVALRKTGEALSYVRRNDLHVKAVRVAWSIVEASVAAAEAYRDEEGWQDSFRHTRSQARTSSDLSSQARLQIAQ